MRDIKLSFCIPTFNRAHLIEVSINSIINSIKNFRDYSKYNFEIIIADNNSTDNTEDVITETINLFEQENITFIYIKNKTNIGASQNLINLPNYASGEYVWFLSDDDYIIETAVSDFFKIYDINYSFIYVSRLLADKELNVLKGTISQPQMTTYNPVFKSGFEMIKIMGLEITTILGFFSSIIIKKDIWIKNCLISNNSSEFLYLKVLLSAIKSEKCYIIANPGVLCRLDYRGFKNNDSIVWLDQYINAFLFANTIGYDEMTCNKMIEHIYKSQSKLFVLDKARRVRNGNLFSSKKALGYTGVIYNKWFIISILPQFMLTTIYSVLYKLSKYMTKIDNIL